MLPLCVDLDGTLVRCDTSWRALWGATRRSPLVPFAAVWWLLRGKCALKCRLAERCIPDAATLPYREELLAYLREQKAHGRTIVLATGTHERIAAAVAEHLGVFDAVVATSPTVNMVAAKKADALVRMFGERGFAYVGNSRADRAVWARAQDIMVAGSSPWLAGERRRAARVFP